MADQRNLKLEIVVVLQIDYAYECKGHTHWVEHDSFFIFMDFSSIQQVNRVTDDHQSLNPASKK